MRTTIHVHCVQHTSLHSQGEKVKGQMYCMVHNQPRHTNQLNQCWIRGVFPLCCSCFFLIQQLTLSADGTPQSPTLINDSQQSQFGGQNANHA